MATRYGFGAQKDTDADRPQFEGGHVDVSDVALRTAIEQNENLPPKVAIAEQLLEGTDYEVVESDD